MKKIYSSQNQMMVGYLKGILKDYGIACLIKNEHLSGAAGELPPIECWPELWVTQDCDAEVAQNLVAAVLGTDAANRNRVPWKCPNCGELVDGQFAACWNCCSDHPEYTHEG